VVIFNETHSKLVLFGLLNIYTLMHLEKPLINKVPLDEIFHLRERHGGGEDQNMAGQAKFEV